MNYCSECGSELIEGAKFCPECGVEIAAIIGRREVGARPARDNGPNTNWSFNPSGPFQSIRQPLLVINAIGIIAIISIFLLAVLTGFFGGSEQPPSGLETIGNMAIFIVFIGVPLWIALLLLDNILE